MGVRRDRVHRSLRHGPHRSVWGVVRSVRPIQLRSHAAVVLVLAASCALHTTPPPTPLQTSANLTVTGSALRIQVRALAGPYVGQIEAAADDAAQRCGDTPSVVIRALEWKLNAVPLAQNALFQPDPLVALLDGWAYSVQMRDFLQSEQGRAALGACDDDAAAAMDRLSHQELNIATRFAPETAVRIEERVERWAAEHPLPSLSAPRATAAFELASESARRDLGALAAVGSIVETLDDVMVQIAAYRETLLKEARWTGELAAAQLGASDVATRLAADAERFATAADRASALMVRIPLIVEQERKASMADIDAQRVATLAALEAQTDAVMTRLQAQTDVVMNRIDATSRTAIDQVAEVADRVIDRAALRAAQVVLAFAAIVAVGAVLVAWILAARLRRQRFER